MSLEEALQLHRQGRAAEAERCYRSIIADGEEGVLALDYLGVLMAQQGRMREAAELFARAVTAEPDRAEFRLHLADALKDCGHQAEAVKEYEQALSLRPGLAGAALNMANCLKRLGQLEDAVAAYRYCLSSEPNNVGAIANLGLTVLDQGNAAEAIGFLSRALSLDPNNGPALFGLATAQLKLKRPHHAEKSLRRLVALDPSDHEAFGLLSETEQRLGRLLESLDSIDQAVRLFPEEHSYHFRRGTLLQELGRKQDAAAEFHRALDLNPGYSHTYLNLAAILTETGFTEEAEETLSRGIVFARDSGDLLRIRKALLLPQINRSNEQIDAAREKLRSDLEELAENPPTIQNPVSDVGPPVFYLTYHGRNDVALSRQIANIHLRSIKDLNWTSPHCLSPGSKSSGARLRLGVMSGQFANHTVGVVNEGLVRSLDRSRFEVVLFRPDRYGSTPTAFDQWADRSVSLPMDLRAREAISEAELDVLYYPDIGDEPLSYFLSFARLAPVQCAGWGHPNTSGIPNVDYYLSSETFEPESGQEAYSETLVKLGRLYAHLSPPEQTSDALERDDFGLTKSATVYLCPQSLFKLHPDFDSVLADLLRQDAKGIVLLVSRVVPHWKELLEKRFADSMPEVANRIRIVDRVPTHQFPALLRMADAVIDPIHCTGGYTSYLAFGAGEPVVTWNGQFMRGRMTSGLYRQMGIEGPTADDSDQFVKLAIRLANDKDYKNRMRASIAERSPLLFEDLEPIRELEEFFLAAHRGALEGKKVEWRSNLSAHRS